MAKFGSDDLRILVVAIPVNNRVRFAAPRSTHSYFAH